MGIGSEESLVSVAFANDRAEAEMIQGLLESCGIPSAQHHLGIDGPTVGIGLLNPGGGARRVMVRADHAEQARALLAETAGEEGTGRSISAEHPLDVEDVPGREPRNYNLIGAYARAWTLSLVLMSLAFGVFMLLRVL
jgi:putative signal transducing protein